MGSTSSQLKDYRNQVKTRFAAHLKQVREAKGLTGTELARRAVLDRGNYYRLEGGKVNPSLSMLVRLAAALEMSLEEFLEGLVIEVDLNRL
ncbi:MAG: helix-turn-helix transcriptional regulator [Bacteroidota bacterium]